MELRPLLYNSFELIYPEKRLIHISLRVNNGDVVASVFYKDNTGKKYIETYDSKSTAYELDYLDEGGNIERVNTYSVSNLFSKFKSSPNQIHWFTYDDYFFGEY